jgi:hypothetical protein
VTEARVAARRLVAAAAVVVVLLFLAYFYRSSRPGSHAGYVAPYIRERPQRSKVPRFIASAPEPSGQDDGRAARSTTEVITMGVEPAKAASHGHSYNVVHAVSLGAVRESIKAIGGDLWRTIAVQDRGFYLSYAGGIFECAEAYMRRVGLKSWNPTGSVRFDVEVVEGTLFIRKALPFKEPDYAYKPDRDFWKCYEGAVTQLAFHCNGCKMGKQTFLWLLKPTVQVLGVGADAGVGLPDPSRDNVLVLLKKEASPQTP